MIRLLKVSAFCLVLFLSISTKVFAQSDYVLPYPSGMPGNSFYKIHQIYEFISRYWYFGNIGQFKYNLRFADKYLVEAKTLFEYKQYFLGYGALKKSDQYFANIFPYLMSSEKSGNDIAEKEIVLSKAAEKHIEVLKKMKLENPEMFNWEPEKISPTVLNIGGAILEAINIRSKYL